MIDLPTFNIGNLVINIIQGGMGVRISGKYLASAVANCGGAGIIATVGLGLFDDEEDSKLSYAEANQQALREEIRAARQMSNGVIGVNIMFALKDYEQLVEVAVDEEVDLIISGAGVARHLPDLVGDKDICLVPIVSSAKAARTITNAWERQNKVPDAFIVEGPKAGGHLGFAYDDLVNETAPKLEDIAKGVIDFAKNSFETPVPVVVAGGIYTGQDIAYYKNEIKAAGVQMATRFVTTLECDASDKFKLAYLNAKKENIRIIRSPVGLPGRAIMNDFLERAQNKEIKVKCKSHCLKACKQKESLYCIAEALVNAQKGHLGYGFAFAGANAYRATPESCLDSEGKFITVKTLMERLSKEYHSSL